MVVHDNLRNLYVFFSEQKKQAKFFDNIMTQVRAESEYFRVGFYGKGFPLSVRVRKLV